MVAFDLQCFSTFLLLDTLDEVKNFNGATGKTKKSEECLVRTKNSDLWTEIFRISSTLCGLEN